MLLSITDINTGLGVIDQRWTTKGDCPTIMFMNNSRFLPLWNEWKSFHCLYIDATEHRIRPIILTNQTKQRYNHLHYLLVVLYFLSECASMAKNVLVHFMSSSQAQSFLQTNSCKYKRITFFLGLHCKNVFLVQWRWNWSRLSKRRKNKLWKGCS